VSALLTATVWSFVSERGRLFPDRALAEIKVVRFFSLSAKKIRSVVGQEDWIICK
jgi:hypothetical protein